MEYNNPYHRWRETTKPTEEVLLEVRRWHAAEGAILDSTSATDNLFEEHWTRHPVNDPVRAIAEYGRSRLITKGWKDLPIQIPENEREEWRKDGYSVVTFDELRAFQLSAAGEFLAVAGQNPTRIGELLMQGVSERVAKMNEAANRPREFYQPKKWDLDSEIDQEELLDEAFEHEFCAFDLPFVLREELECFSYGMQHLRIMCHDEEPELGLPNQALFEALARVDLNQLHTTLLTTDSRLKEILKHLASVGFRNNVELNEYLGDFVPSDDRLLDSAVAPDGFWWRHWYGKQSSKKQ